MITILYFASLAESLQLKKEHFTPESTCDSVNQLVDLLKQRGGLFAEAFNGDTVLLCAVNQEMATFDTAIKAGDEVAFFPPVTGG